MDAVASQIQDAHERGALTWPAITSLLSRRRTAAELQVCVSTIDRLIKEGSLTPTRIGTRVFISRDALADFIERHTDRTEQAS